MPNSAPIPANKTQATPTPLAAVMPLCTAVAMSGSRRVFYYNCCPILPLTSQHNPSHADSTTGGHYGRFAPLLRSVARGTPTASPGDSRPNRPLSTGAVSPPSFVSPLHLKFHCGYVTFALRPIAFTTLFEILHCHRNVFRLHKFVSR